ACLSKIGYIWAKEDLTLQPTVTADLERSAYRVSVKYTEGDAYTLLPNITAGLESPAYRILLS
ncbi:MAG: hypothetical protein ABEI54_00630, partial [Candidatus Bipolaricaulia bacterium]